VSPVKYELGFYIPDDGILHSLSHTFVVKLVLRTSEYIRPRIIAPMRRVSPEDWELYRPWKSAPILCAFVVMFC
jgi:hypothetical protein